MNRDDIIRMAREAGIDEPESDWMYWAAMERFAALVRADEREAVARIVTGLCISDNNAEEINRAIRARGRA